MPRVFDNWSCGTGGTSDGLTEAEVLALAVKPDYEAAEIDAAGILNKPDLTQSETYNVAKAAADGYVKGVSRILWNGYQYILNTDAALQAARGNTDTVDQTVLPSADPDMGGLDAHWVRVATEEEIVREAGAHGPIWSSDRAIAGVWPDTNSNTTGSDGNGYRLSNNAIGGQGTSTDAAARDAIAASHGDVVTLDSDGLAYWFDSRSIVSGVANPDQNTWVSFGSSTVGVVPANAELNPASSNSSWNIVDRDVLRSAHISETIDNSGTLNVGAMINEGLAAVLIENPLVVGKYGSSGSSSAGQGVGGNRIKYGGGILRLRPGKYLLETPLQLPPNVELELNAAHLIASPLFPPDRAMVETIQFNSIFSRTGARVTGRSGSGMHGENIARDGIQLRLANFPAVSGLIIEGFQRYGVTVQQSQQVKLYDVSCLSNGEYGFHLGTDLATSATFGSNDITATGCTSEKNGIGGVLIESSATSTWTGCTLQFNGNGAGVRIMPSATGGCYGHTFNGTHFEGNKFHVEILRSGNNIPIANSFHGGYWVIDDGTGVGDGTDAFPTQRFIINEGIKTGVYNGGSFNNASMPASLASSGTGVATTALFEQSSLVGDMHVHDFFSPKGGINPSQPYACDENGNIWDEGINPANGSFAVTAIGLTATGGSAFPKGSYWGPEAINV